MGIKWDWTLTNALERIKFKDGEVWDWQISAKVVKFPFDVVHLPLSEYHERYERAQERIVRIVNYVFDKNFDLSHWPKKPGDELAFFLVETGNNAMWHSQFQAPYRHFLFVGEQEFVVGISQKGRGFNAREVDKLRQFSYGGRAFEFYRGCRSTIFFDNPESARVVFMEHHSLV